MFRYLGCILLIMFIVPGGASATASCGGDRPCMVTGGNYRIELPEDDDLRGAFVFFHGFKGSAELGSEQEQFEIVRGLYQPKTAIALFSKGLPCDFSDMIRRR
ncbi:putative secreted protein (plasmid) [Rhizobium favelukesii]|uniref:Secreted protein n=1 Tax=Rhizobium favelukesii TaxID=348824 RepID=W6RKW0_9HYPH|nr:putative secreted protein [Rhizobium favelukesii]